MEEKHYYLILIVIAYVVLVYLFSAIGKKREIGRWQLFWLSLFFTPLLGLAFFFNSQHRKINFYTEDRFKCESCGYVFSEHHDFCPICEKEGKRCELTPVSMFMT
jgi:hypothetical protein